MATERDLNVSLHKKETNEVLNLYPETKTENVHVTDEQTLDKYLSLQNKINESYLKDSKKLSQIEDGAQKNQNAFSAVKSGNFLVEASKAKDTLELIAGSNISINIIDNKITFNASKTDVTKADATTDGLMSSKDYKKLKNIEENANNYVHPASGVVPNTYIRVTVDKNGHVTKGNNDVLKISEGGTGVSTLLELKKLIGLDNINIEHSVKENSSNPVTSSGIYKALQEKANTNHGNHVPDSSDSPDSFSFLKEGNVWESIPSGNTSQKGVIQLTNEIGDSESLGVSQKGLKSLSDSITTKIDGLKGNPESGFDTLEKIATRVNTVTDTLTTHTSNSTIHISADERKKWNAKSDVKLDTSLSNTSTNAISNKAVTDALTTHTSNSTIHITADERKKWNGILEKAKAYTDEKYGSIDKIDFYVIESGTHESITSPSKSLIYLEKASSGTQYESWIYRDKWMNIGSDDLNLNNYYNKTEVVELINNSKPTVDSALSSTSENPVQNKVINSALGNKANSNELSTHTSNSTIHITADERTKWNAKSDVKLDTALSNTSTNAISNKAVTDALTTHTSNTAIHITADERKKWNNAASSTVTVDTALSNTSTNAISNKAVKNALDNKANNTDLTNKVDKVNGKGLSTNDFTNALKSNYDNAYTHSTSAHAPSNAEKNVIVGIQKNGTDITPNTSTRKVNITVPTKISELTNDSGYISKHPSVGIGSDTTSTKSINIKTGDSFNVVDSVTRDSNGHVTKINVKTITVPKHDNSGGGTGVIRSATAPSNTTVLWIDISSTNEIPKYYNGSAWVTLPAVWG